MFGMSPRDLKRAMQRLGIKVEEVESVRVEIFLADGSKLVFDDPQVLLITAKGQPPMIQVVGDYRRVEPEPEKTEEEPPFTEEDVALVAEQAGVSLEEAQKALEEAGGDIAEAILRLQGQG